MSKFEDDDDAHKLKMVAPMAAIFKSSFDKTFGNQPLKLLPHLERKVVLGF